MISYKFTKKPITIEALQMTDERLSVNDDWPKWLHVAWQSDPCEGSFWRDNEDGQFYCGTLEGVHKVTPNDYIIQGVKGEIYPCKPDIFEMTYSPTKIGDNLNK